MTPEKQKYMKQAIELAKIGRGNTSPNPMVGAVIVKNDKILSKGYHKGPGTLHAEAKAIKNSNEPLKEATLYVNLEPCDHHGKTSPCTDKIINSGIDKVVIAMKDPNPKSGNGIKKLKEHGVKVETGLMKDKARKLNEVFVKNVTENLPFIVSKSAMTLDGKIASKTGNSKWISNEKSRKLTHELRDRYDAILVGVNTVLADDPRLTTRLEGRKGQNPLRVVLDNRFRTPLDSKVLNEEGKCLIVVNELEKDKKNKINKLKSKENVKIHFKENKNLKPTLEYLIDKNICSVLIEGGSKVNWSFYKDKLVDKIYLFVGPKIVGGKKALNFVGGEGFEKIEDSVKIENIKTELLDNDILIKGYLRK